ncbi:hypothetical protein V6Z11_A03G201500 [Gossypium hirsutum]
MAAALHDAPIKEMAWDPEISLLVTGSWVKTLKFYFLPFKYKQSTRGVCSRPRSARLLGLHQNLFIIMAICRCSQSRPCSTFNYGGFPITTAKAYIFFSSISQSWQGNPIKVTKPRVNSVQVNIDYNRINGGRGRKKELYAQM